MSPRNTPFYEARVESARAPEPHQQRLPPPSLDRHRSVVILGAAAKEEEAANARRDEEAAPQQGGAVWEPLHANAAVVVGVRKRRVAADEVRLVVVVRQVEDRAKHGRGVLSIVEMPRAVRARAERLPPPRRDRHVFVWYSYGCHEQLAHLLGHGARIDVVVNRLRIITICRPDLVPDLTAAASIR